MLLSSTRYFYQQLLEVRSGFSLEFQCSLVLIAADFEDVIYGNGYEFLNRLRDLLVRTGNMGTIMRVQQLEVGLTGAPT